MKLLGWMHRKFRQNSAEPIKDLLMDHSYTCFSGRVSIDEHYQNKAQLSRNAIKQKDQFAYRKSFAGLEENNKEEEEETEEPISELFTNWHHGFLAIGTLGSDTIENETQIPHFDLENITENETEVTANDIRLINDELEKVFGEEICESGRNSHVSVNVKPENGEINGQICPLQGYLFGSPIELPVKREHRTSLGELFQKSKATEQYCGLLENGKSGKHEGFSGKNEEKKQPEEKSGVHLVKKMLKRRPRNTTPDSVAAENKIHKLLHMFHRKVHPESTTFAKKPTKAHMKEEIKNTAYEEDVDENEGQVPVHDAHMLPQRTMPRGGIWRHKCNSNPPPFAVSGSDSNGNREYWIKTDADYLVLEL